MRVAGAVFLITAVFASSLALGARQAHAGILSVLSEWLAAKEVAALPPHLGNSQNVALLRAAVNPDPNPSKGGGNISIVGGSALLPDSGPLGTIADVEDRSDETSPDQISIYVVRKGDSLSQISDMFDVSVNTIIWANDIEEGDVIREGQQLVILPVTGIRYEVESGDTLNKIAKKFGGETAEIAQFNDIKDNSQLSIGDTIIIPEGEISAPNRDRSGHGTHAVVRGTGAPHYEGYFGRPIQGGHKTQGLHGYNAVDIGAPFGTPVLASANGKVIISRGSGWNGGYGKYLVVSHPNGTQTLYSHLNSLLVSAGSSVVKGQVIGYVGSTGRSTGPHVHFEIRGAKNPF